MICGEEVSISFGISAFGVEYVSGFGVEKFLRGVSMWVGAICSWLGGGGEGCLMVLSDA